MTTGCVLLRMIDDLSAALDRLDTAAQNLKETDECVALRSQIGAVELQLLSVRAAAQSLRVPFA